MDRTWDGPAVAKLVGKWVHPAVTHADAQALLIREAQIYGWVVTADRAIGTDLELNGGRRLPPAAGPQQLRSGLSGRIPRRRDG